MHKNTRIGFVGCTDTITLSRVEESLSVLQNVQLRRHHCKSHCQSMDLQQDPSCVCHALLVSKRQADHWKLRFKMAQRSLNKRQAREKTLKKWLKCKNLHLQELRISGREDNQAKPNFAKKAPVCMHGPQSE